MNIADAINKAADHIAENPCLYDFNQGTVLGRENDISPACMLARIGQVAGVARGMGCEVVALCVLGMTPSEFYGHVMREAGQPRDRAALYHAEMVAPAMRRVAQKYFGIPQEVRSIFDVEDARAIFEGRYRMTEPSYYMVIGEAVEHA